MSGLIWLTFWAVLLTFARFCKILGVWYSRLCFYVTDILASMFQLYFQWLFYCITRKKKQSSSWNHKTLKQSMIYPACSLTSTFSFWLIRHPFTYTSILSVSLSLPAGVRLLCKAAWMGREITECCLSSWFPFHFEVSPARRNRGYKARLVWGL